MNLPEKIEALLFASAKPVSIKWLSDKLGEDKKEVRLALEALQAAKKDKGVVVIKTGEYAELRTNPEVSDAIKEIFQKELTKNIGPAASEVLSIIIFKGPIQKSDIEYIRGVDSSSSLRTLMIRGLIKRNDKKYEVTTELISHLGVSAVEEIPNYEEIRAELNKIDSHED